MPWSKLCYLLILLCAPLSLASGQQKSSLFELDLEQLMQLPITTVSKSEEALIDAPATVILITQQQIQQRGYSNLSEVFDDLPSMDIARPFGDNYFKNYVRGFRNTIGSPYLVMLDGVVVNSLYFNIITAIDTMPLSHIDRIEVLYGPASVAYGANAFMGVLNIVTNPKPDTSSISLSYSDDHYKTLDAALSDSVGDVNFLLALRKEKGQLEDRIDNNSIYWTQDSLYGGSGLWGASVNTYTNSGAFNSFVDNTGIDLRISYNDWLLASQYNLLDTGYGTVYPGDRITANSTWPRIQYTTYLKHSYQPDSNFSLNTWLRYRYDGIKNSAYDLEGYNRTNTSAEVVEVGGVSLAPGESARFLHFQYWQTRNWSWSLAQDITQSISSKLKMTYGWHYEVKDLQKAYDLFSSGPIGVDHFSVNDPNYWPQRPEQSVIPNNRITWRDKSVYALINYSLSATDALYLGARVDDNSAFKSNTSFRGGYVGHFDKWTLKLLYGEAYYQPTPRNLYGAWEGSGSDPNLMPELSNTTEVSLAYTTQQTHHLFSTFYADIYNTIVNFSGGAQNLGERKVVGSDYHVRYQFASEWLGKLELWGYLSYLWHAEEAVYDFDSNQYLGDQAIGDLAKFKALAGVNLTPNDAWNINLRSRYIDQRDTVATNPISQVASYFTVDLNVRYQGFAENGVTLALKVNNLFDRKYYHPGLREANSGIPGSEDEVGFSGENGLSWNGSQGWYNSLLPQPGRVVQLTATYQF